jgi:DNA end-binding protein Ku
MPCVAKPRSIWNGWLSWGTVNVPVKLYSAVSSKTIRFRELREKDGSRVRHKRVAESDGEEVAYEDLVKGYEISPEQYVILSREELDSLAPKRSKAIEIEDFVDLDQIDPIYFNQPYYLGPAPGAERAYALLAEAMGEQGKVAIARFVLRNRESLCAIRAGDGVLTLATMRFADEVVPASQLEGLLGEELDTPPRKQEIEMAKQLIESLSTDFKPSGYEDEYRSELLSLIERKAAGEDVLATAPEAPKATKAPDLMAALEESLAAIKGDELSGGAERKPKAKAKAPAKKASAKKPATKAKSKSRAKAAK